ncbi:MAG: glycosyltransferase [Myxococcales bacterium]
MRIVVTGANQAVVGGAETYLTWLLRTLLGRGHDVAFAFERAASNPEQAVDRGLPAMQRWNSGAMNRAEYLFEVANFRPDIVFLQGASDESLDLALAERFRAVLFAHAFYGTCATGWKVHHLPTLQLCTRPFGSACLPINYLRGCGARSPIQLLNVYAAQRAREKVLHSLAGVVVASEYMRQVYLQNGTDDRNVRVLPPPGNLEPDAIPPSLRDIPSRVLFLGRFTAGKGAVRAIQAVARCQGSLRDRAISLTMAGDGPELARCQRLARELDVSVDFPGWVDSERRLTLLRNADVLIVPSQWPEPFGMVGIEAGSLGVPAVAYRAGGIVDWLEPGVSGELAEPFGSRTLAGALERALRDPGHHHQLQLGAWRAAHEFSGRRHVTGLEQFFREISPSA